MLYTIVAVLVLVLDQAVKFYTVNNIPPQAIGDACKTLIPGVIHMTNVQNYGAAFSILENAQVVLIAVSVLFIIGIIVLISMDIIHTRFGRWTAVLVMAGALGNCIDRILLGYVVDMFEFERFTFAVFNVADIFITVCGILFCIHVIVYREPEEERNAVPRPEKKKSGLFASRALREPQDLDEEEAQPASAARRPAKLRSASRKNGRAAAPAAEEEPASPAPSRERRSRRRAPELEEDIPSQTGGDPFAEWEDDDYVRPAKPRTRKAAETPAPRQPRRAPEEAPAAKPSRPAKRQAPAVAAEDDWDDLETPAPRKAAPRKAAAPARPAPPPQEEKLASPVEDAGFDEYSLEDILAEFRDS